MTTVSVDLQKCLRSHLVNELMEMCYVQLACPVLSVEGYGNRWPQPGEDTTSYGWASLPNRQWYGLRWYAVVGAGRQGSVGAWRA